MKILFLHLSDAHILNEESLNMRKIKKLVDSLNRISFDECLIIFSGDLAYSGGLNEYKHVKTLFNNLINKIKQKHEINEIKTLIVPGNHDVQHGQNAKTRNDFVKLSKNNKMNDELENELKKMDSFFEFANEKSCFKKNKMVENKILDFDNYKVSANLINSAVFSVLDDEKGVHYLPNNYIDLLYDSQRADLNINIIHHGPEWFMPDNKNVLEKALYRNSAITFMGHEHDNEERNININNSHNVDVIRGGIFNDSYNQNVSEFYSLLVDTKRNKYDLYFASWNKEANFYNFKLKHENKKIRRTGFKPKEDFLVNFLEDKKHNLSDKFSDYFVFPRIEKEDQKLNSLEYEIHNENDLKNEILDHKKLLITGDENSGKTVLLKAIYLLFYFDEKIPLFFGTEDIKNKRVDKMIKTSFEEQYSDKEVDYNKFRQIRKENKVAIVDDVNLIDRHCIKNFIIELKKEFRYIVLAGNKDLDFDIRNKAKEKLDIFKNFGRYNISKFYSDKRIELIENVCEINPNKLSNNKKFAENLNRNIKNQIHLFRLDPDFIIQYTNFFCNNGYSYSSDGEVYSKIFEANITNSLERYTTNVNINKIFIILNKIAYYIHKNKKYPLSLEEFSNIINEYNSDYDQSLKPKEMLESLKKAKIMNDVDDSFNIKFTNNNYLAYFIARELIDQYINSGNFEDIEYILDNICFGINGEIILFISYLTNNTRILENILKKATTFLGDWKEFSIDKKNIEFIYDFNSSLEISLPTKEDKEEYEKIAVKHEKKMSNQKLIKTVDIYNYDEDEINLMTNKLTKSLKYGQILAKILPSFEHILKGDKKEKFVNSIYVIPNKILYYWLKNIDDNLEEITNDICEMMVESGICKKKDKERAKSFLEDISTAMILSIYDNICNLATKNNTIEYWFYN